MKTKCENRVRTVNEWCRDNRLKIISWDESDRSNIVYTSLDDDRYNYTRNIKRVIYKQNEIGKNMLTTFNNMTKESRSRYVCDKITELKKEGVEVSFAYTESINKTVPFIVSSGKYKGLSGNVKIKNLIFGSKDIENRIFINLNKESKRLYFDAFCENRGYKIKTYPNNMKKSEKCTLITPKGNEWNVIWGNFEYGNDSYPGERGNSSSYGERVVAAILDKNNINYSYQHKISHEDGTWQYMDFYISEGKICIEYNGKQHYEDTSFFNTNLEEQAKRDLKKKKYCTDNDILFVEIPYTEDSVSKVFKSLKIKAGLEINKLPSYLEVENSLGEKDGVSDTEVIEYFKNHTQKETSERFDFSVGKLNNICKRAGYKKIISPTKKTQRVVGKNINGDVVEFSSMKQAYRDTGVDVKSFFLKKDQKKPTKGWIFKKVS